MCPHPILNGRCFGILTLLLPATRYVRQTINVAVLYVDVSVDTHPACQLNIVWIFILGRYIVDNSMFGQPSV